MENSTFSAILSSAVPVIAAAVGKVSFSWYDYILFCFMLAISAVIGIYFGCFGSKQATANEYLMGGKKMAVFPISMSLVASHISGITLLAVPADVYRFGSAYWLMCPAIIFVCFVTAQVFLPVFHKLQVTSTYEYLERRFDSRARLLASFLFALSLLLYLPIVIYIPALAFSAATGINVHLITPVVCGVCIFYTTLGGLKAVVWTDTLQFAVTVGAVVTVFFLGLNSVGGIGNVFRTALEGDRLNIFDFDPDPTKRDSFWIVIISVSIGWIGMAGIHQSCVQKYLSVSSLREAKMTVYYFTLGIVVISTFSVLTGLIMYAKYAHCDPFTTGEVTRNDQLLPYYVMDVASQIPGLSGLFIAGVFCAALSTLSASLNCLAGTVYEDFVLKFTGNVSESAAGHYLRAIVILAGAISTGLVLVIEHLGGILPLAISLGSVSNAPLLGMFTIGILYPKATRRGAFWGAVTGLLFAVCIVVGAKYNQAKNLIVYEPKPISTDGCLPTNTSISSVTTPHYFEANITTFERDFVQNSTDFIKEIQEEQSSPKPENEKPAPEKPFILFRVSYYYYTPMGTAVTIIAAILISHLFPSDDPPVHRDLLSPVIYFMLPAEKVKNVDKKEYFEIDRALNLVTVGGIKTTKKEESVY